MPYLKIEKDCGNKKGCFPTNYKTYKIADYYEDIDSKNTYHKIILNDGMAVAIWSNGSCKITEDLYTKNKCGSFRVDINSTKGPNKSGIDLFLFTITKDGLVPATGATSWVFYKKNLNYLREDVEFW